MKKDSILYVVLFTFAVCAAFVVVLAVANEVTKPLVAANKLFATRSAVLGAFGIPYADAVDASAKYEAQVGELERGNSWTSTIDGVEYVAIESAGPGLWGTIRIILAASPDGERVRGIRVVSQNETPGLGGRIEEPWFPAASTAFPARRGRASRSSPSSTRAWQC
ncbi:MAG: hypothetical protein CVV51_00720 [Spirochaetae bacterium HGW-Spirochaetae-7]|nr:MAG: hypothetical protein CVV51_00720 [Spirochaetae bacterium HGW-Spirochaetae-7]